MLDTGRPSYPTIEVIGQGNSLVLVTRSNIFLRHSLGSTKSILLERVENILWGGYAVAEGGTWNFTCFKSRRRVVATSASQSPYNTEPV